MLDREAVRLALAGHPCLTLDLGVLRPSAVLLLLFDRDGEDHVLLTRRTDHLPHHQGEIAFPGGARQPEDPDLLATALRETEEEMGIGPADVTVLGRLDDIISIHGYHVAPFVGTFRSPYPFRVNHREIAEVIELPLAVFAAPGVFRREDWQHRGRHLPVCFYTVGRHEIWGLTAAVLHQFLERIAPLLPSAILR